MAVLEDLASSDDEDAASRADRAASAPNMSFDDMLKQAGEIKQRQMRDKRRAWEATAEFMKNTIAYDKNETYLDLRSNATVADRVAFAEPIKAEGNALFAEGKYAKAMDKYTEAVAVLRYWNRVAADKEQRLECHRDDEALPEDSPERRAATRFLLSVFLNAAACALKMRPPRGDPEQVVWICGEALAMDPRCAKAYYRRAMARVQMDTAAALETAVADLKRASALAPNDATVRAALETHRAACDAQRKKDKKTYGVMFAADATLYSAEETETATETAAAKKPSAPAPADPFEGMSEEEFKARARSSGIDLDDPAVRREMKGRARARMLERRRREERAKAEELGIDLDDPEVKRVLELLDREERRKAEARDAYRAWARRWFDKTKWLNVQNVLYAALAVRGRARRDASFFRRNSRRVASRRVAYFTPPSALAPSDRHVLLSVRFVPRRRVS